MKKPMTIGQKLKKLRKLVGLSQNELAKRTGIRQGTISRLENGIATSMRSSNVTKIASCLGVSVDLIIGDRDHGIPSDYIGHDTQVNELIEVFSKCDIISREQIMAFARFIKERTQTTTED